MEHQFRRDDEAGVRFGHGTKKWAQKRSLISLQSIKVFILQISQELLVFLSEAYDLVFDAASRGTSFLIVSTKNKATDVATCAPLSTEYNKLFCF